MLIRNAEIFSRGIVSVRIVSGKIQEIGAQLAPVHDEEILDAHGGALLPGLHDHHLHLFALAATQNSVSCGPPHVTNFHEFQEKLHRAKPHHGTIRGVGYHECVAGELDRQALDRVRSDLPLRIQHRTGALWILNSRAIEALQLDNSTDLPGIERDAHGHATGRFFRCDNWLRERFPSSVGREDLACVSRKLANVGITSLSDASASNRKADWNAFAASIRRGAILQNVQVLGDFDLPAKMEHIFAGRESSATPLPALTRGAVKILLQETAFPTLDELATKILRAHAQDRGVALHCVTRAELIFATSSLAQAGIHEGDRIEHASVTPPDAIELLTTLAPREHDAGKCSLQIVTQPHFLFERGDSYLDSVDACDLPWLYRGRALLDAGLRLRAGSDAPYGDLDPWQSMRSAVERKTVSGKVLDEREALSPEEAFLLFAPATHEPIRDFARFLRERIAPGQLADLCLLDRPWQEARHTLSSEMVHATFRAGVFIGGKAAR